MTKQDNTSNPFEAAHIPVQFKLSAAWASFMFLYIYVDYLMLHKPGHLEGVLAGMIWEFEISQTFMVIAFTSIAIPSFMILLSMLLPARISRVTNLVVATLYIPYSMFNAVGENWVVFFGLSIGLELLLLAFILRSAWTWPRVSANTAMPSGQLRQTAHA